MIQHSINEAPFYTLQSTAFDLRRPRLFSDLLGALEKEGENGLDHNFCVNDAEEDEQGKARTK